MIDHGAPHKRRPRLTRFHIYALGYVLGFGLGLLAGWVLWGVAG